MAGASRSQRLLSLWPGRAVQRQALSNPTDRVRVYVLTYLRLLGMRVLRTVLRTLCLHL